ncbi:MAG: VCBS domain-containing protein, partial [Alphaproteobacteria bacterium]|nr:VCBS domain-containing protein [Alphaproteobacteria bacterium]
MASTDGTSLNDKLIGGSGADLLLGGAGTDFLNGGSGNDILDGGSGIDTVLGGSGSDTLIFRSWENEYDADGAVNGVAVFTGYDYYDGGNGNTATGTAQIDTLLIFLSNEQIDNADFMAAFEADVAAFQSFIEVNTNVSTGQASQAVFTFTSINLQVSAIENIYYGLDPGSPRLVSTLPDVSLLEDAAIAIALPAGAFVDGSGDVMTYSLAAGAPSWLTIDSATGEISGVPPADYFGSLNITVIASDGTLSAHGTFALDIQAVNDAPQLAVLAGLTTDEDLAISSIDVLSGATAGPANESGQTLSVAAASALHGTVTVNADGTLNYAADANYYGADTISYVVQDSGGTANGGLDQMAGSIAVTINAVNDAPVLAGNQSAAVSEIFTTSNGVVAGSIEASGSIGFNDVDLTDTHTVSASLASATWSQPGSIPADTLTALGVALAASLADDSTGDGTGSVDWNFSIDNPLLVFLAQGETLTLAYDVSVDDGAASGTSHVTITVTGTNNVPVVTAVTGDSAGHGFVETDAGLAWSGTLTVFDRDLSDNVDLSVSNVQILNGSAGDISLATLKSFFTLDESVLAADPGSDHNLHWNFNSGAEAFNYLGAGEELRLLYSIKAENHYGLGNDAGVGTAVIVITGTNDGATITGDTSGTIGEDDTSAVTGTLAVADPDTGEAHTVAASGTTTYGTYSIDADGHWSYVLDNAAVQSLDDGETASDSFVVTSKDGTASQTVTITVAGADDNLPPVIGDDSFMVDEDIVASGNLLANDSDPNGDSLVVSEVNGVAADVGQTIILASGAKLTVQAGGSYSYDQNGVFNALAAGTQASDSFSYAVSDGNGGTTTATVDITIDGVNDAPALDGLDAAVTFAENTVNASPQLLDINVDFSDPEDNFDGGSLTVSGLLAEDAVSVRNEGSGIGQIGFDGTNVSFGGVVIGAVSGGSGTTLTVTFNAVATSAGVEALIENLTYANGSDTPAATRTLTVNVTDSLGASIVDQAHPIFGFGTNPFAGFDVGNAARPTLADLDNDGDLDAIVGAQYGGLHYFENTGSATAPAFVEQSGAANVVSSITFSTPGWMTPEFADLDNDGDLDAVVGENDGRLFYFENAGDASTPIFESRTGASNPFDSIDAGRLSAPAFGDLDGDGDLDLVSGAEGGGLQYFLNTGTASNPVFVAQTAAANPFNGIQVGSGANVGSVQRTTPALADIDHDGDLDVVAGTSASGYLQVLQNTGDASNPQFVALQGSDNPLIGFYLSFDMKPAVADLNNDGNLDFVVGNSAGTIGYLTSAPGVGAPIVVNVTAENDAATITGGTSGTIGEDDTGAVAGTLLVTDPDSGQAHTVVASGSTTYGTYSIDADGHWSYVLDNAAVQQLGADESVSDSFVATSLDGTASETVAITITGQNDAPVITSSTPDLSDPDNLVAGAGVGATVVGLFNPASSVNLIDGQPALVTTSAHQYAYVMQAVPTSFPTGANYMGGHDWFVDHGIDAAALKGGLVVFDSGVVGYIDVAYNGTTGEPAYIYYRAYDVSVTEDENVSSGGISTSQTVAFADIDLSDTHTVAVSTASIVGAPSIADGLIPSGGFGTLTASVVEDAGDTDPNGVVQWTFTAGNDAVQGLGAGEFVTQIYTLTVSDGHGGVASRDVAVTIWGADDNLPPVLGDDSFTVDEDVIASGNLLANDSDPNGDSLVVSDVNGVAADVGQT